MTARHPLELRVGDDEAGERLDRVCAARRVGEGLSRSAIAHACEAGGASVNGRVAKAATRLRAGDHVVLQPVAIEPLSAAPEDIPLTVIYEDDALLVIDKPAGLVVHPARGHAHGTLVNAVLHHAAIDAVDDAEALRPGIVHRLDKDTSGVLVVAKTAVAREGLKAQFQAHTIERSYVALVEGTTLVDTTFDTLHGRHPSDRKRFSSRVPHGKRAVTHVTVLERFARAGASYVRCRLETGRTHQIRMHLAEAGYPIVGDALYGRTPRSVPLRAIAEALGHQALHAEVLGFVHPVTARVMRFVASAPVEFGVALAALRAG